MASPIANLLVMSREGLDQLYRNSPTGEFPVGEAQGTAIVVPGTFFGKVLATLVRWFVWQGKVFDSKQRILRNKLTPFRIGAIKANVYKDRSWLDDKETIVLDYSKTSLVARKIRDEIREVQPGVYLGKVYWGKTRIADFALAPLGPGVRSFDWGARILFAVILLFVLGAAYLIYRLNIDRPVTYADIEQHFKSG